jgi:hypothetical protein
MKMNSLTTAIAAGVAGVAGLASVANAVNVNPDGLGQVLLFPYYTVNGGNQTLLSVVNTTASAKAVKVRFLESLNSAEVLDFNLYLSPFDVWTAAVLPHAGGATLFTTDTSCTVPNAVGKDNTFNADGTVDTAGQFSAFRPFVFTLGGSAPDIVGEIGQVRLGGTPNGSLANISDAERMTQGHVEMIEMGILGDEARGTAGAFNPALWATHTSANGGAPFSCASLQSAWNAAPAGAWTASQGERAVDTPNGGLFGGGTIVDVAQGRALTYNADAIAGFYVNNAADTSPLAVFPPEVAARQPRVDLHTNPGDLFPNLGDARTGFAADGVTDIAEAIVFDNGALARAQFITAGGGGLDAVSATLTERFIFNEYNLDAGLAAASEWVVTFPTKRLHTYVNVAGSDIRPFSDFRLSGGGAGVANYGEDAETSAGLLDGLHFDTYGLCEVINIRWWDREERTTGATAIGVDISPQPPTPQQARTSLCFEANIIAFNQTLTASTASTVLGAMPTQGALGLNIGTSFESGWARIEFDDGREAGFQNYLISDDTAGVAFVGLPVIGFWAADYNNDNVAEGVRANFSGIHKHRGDKDVYVIAPGATLTGLRAGDEGTPFISSAADVTQFTGS